MRQHREPAERSLAILPALAAAALAFDAGCSNNSPYAQRQRYQEHVARRLAAAELEPGGRAWRARRPMSVRIHAARELRERDHGWLARFEEQVQRASAILEQSLQVKLEIGESRDWEPKSARDDLGALLEELREHDPGEGADWVVGLVGSLPRATLTFTEAGEAVMLGKHLVLRDMNDAEEQRAIVEGFDTLDEATRRRLYQDRKRHKETVILLHEIAHTLGAIHVADPADIMNPAYDNRMQGFAEPNLVLMRRVLEYHQRMESAQPGAEAEELRALVDTLASYVKQAAWDGWIAQERQEYAASLQAASLVLSQAAAQTAPAAEPTLASAAPAAPSAQEDVSALPAAERGKFTRARADLEAGKLEPAWRAAEALAQRHRDSYAVQHLACTAAMRSSRPLASIRRYCDRMTELAVSAADAGR